MIRNFKNTILALSAVGLVVGMHAADDHTPKAASAGKTAAASLAMIVGGAGIFTGLTGIGVQMEATNIPQALPPSLSHYLLDMKSMGWLVVPGTIVAGIAGIYLFKSAKGWVAKLRSSIGSLALVGGGALLAAAYMAYASANTVQAAAAPATLSDLGASIKDGLWYFSTGAKPLTVSSAQKHLKFAGAIAAGGAGLALAGYAIQPNDKK